MEVIFSDISLAQLQQYKLAGDVNSLKKIRQLIESIKNTPYAGLGKPEALKHNFSGKWSRRIDKGNRIIYQLTNDNTINIYAVKGHY